VGISVSRVGSAAQIKAMKTATGTLKSDLQQFRELQAFAAFGSDLDAVSKAQLERGYRLTELLKQGVGEPMSVERQVVSLFAGTRGYLDSIDVSEVRRFEAELLEYFDARYSSLLAEIVSTGTVDADALEAGIKAFAATFESNVEVPVGTAPDGGAADATTAKVTAATHLPEDETTLVADEG